MQAGQYAAAWECATVNRMDLSLIAAHAWPRFLAAAPDFVAAVPKDQDLVDFLTSLQPHNARSGLAVQLKDSEQVWHAGPCVAFALMGGNMLPCLWLSVQLVSSAEAMLTGHAGSQPGTALVAGFLVVLACVHMQLYQ